MVSGLWVFGTVPEDWDCPGFLGQSQSPKTVRGFWDSPRVPGQSRASGTVPESLTYPKFKDFVLAVKTSEI